MGRAKRNFNLIWILLMAAMLVLSACGEKPAETASIAGQDVTRPASSASVVSTKSETESGGHADEVQAGRTVYPLTVQDSTGETFTFERAPQRIVSTSVAETEILFALGLGDQVVGVSDYDNYPPEAAAKPKMGNLLEPNVEAILAAEPDLVVTGVTIEKEALAELRRLGLKVFRTDPQSVEDILNTILLFGQIHDKQPEAEALAAKMREDIRKVTEAAAKIKPEERKKVYLEFSPGWTVGRGEFMDELVQMAGGINIAADLEGWNLISEEKVIAADPDVIIFAAELVDETSGKMLEDIIRERKGWDQISAIANGRMVGIDDDLLSRPGPRITEALLQISEGIYPGAVQR
jgi:iron complex transport system substrate-binding protein